jgi:[phosphatase 2A protein]-leucine-carboxy methyltransferase
MSKKPFKSQASSSRAISNPFASVVTSSNLSFGTGFGGPPASLLSYIYEPPDLKDISDSAVVVAFKNLQKKDSTTKAKALEDLQEFLSNIDKDSPGVEDEILEAWVRLKGYMDGADSNECSFSRSDFIRGRL